MTWDARQRAMLAEMGFRLPAVSRAVAPEPEPEVEPEPIVVAAPPPAIVRVVVPAPAPAPALPSGFAGLDLPALREAVSACRGCGLCEQRRNAVFGAGALQSAQWLVVSDPADEADDAAGEPFSGEAGRLLDRMLAAAGQSRAGEGASAFVTPIVKCRPPRGRAPQPAELDACEAVLARQAELLQPRLVLALGLQAARRLVGPDAAGEPLGRLRGQVHRWRDLPLVVTYHPAYLLRSPADKAGAWDDLCLARETSKT
ncbi:uracil-DNA glycosylase [Pelomonas aquatica]|jgi:uracil-DNA glycosylase family 4|uniref:Type-4 uracil-DNA glycosylase n=1 Tax=Pelomonas aquatica TaxID=431058 RepID=A0A9X4LLD1_9BURK|nr:uracil-DNA glycosylase [Pelomonas aquatica]MCY4755767.1 uracil-DNA glycosylase [Pelomonas aquatica]MDG0865071.1 uracil-DNA glycosylase [Pelomonas aquatica]